MDVVEHPLNPRLVHAVWSCTRTSGSASEGQQLQVLQDFLLDSNTVDATYLTIVGRARAEPLSTAVVVKCVELLKRYLPRFRAAPETLQEIGAFCLDCMAHTDASQPGFLSALRFLNALVARHPGLASPSRTLFKQAEGAEQGQRSSHARQSSRHEQPGIPLVGADERMSEQTPSSSHNKAAGASHEHVTEGTNLVPDMLALGSLSEGSSGIHLLDSCAAFAPSLAWTSDRGAFNSKVSEELSPEALGTESFSVQEQLNTIAALHQARRRQAYHLGSDKFSPKQPPRKRPQRMAYNSSDIVGLSLTEKDVGMILESVCNTSCLPSIWTDLAEANDGSFDSTAASDMCCCLLSHLLLDLWKRAGPETSFTLALVLLQRMLSAGEREAQLRAFDLLYNMSLHCEAFLSSSDNTSSPEQVPDVELATVFSDISIAKSSLGVDNEMAEQIQRWLRILLFELLHFLDQRKEVNEELWQAAIGCLCQLSSIGGELKRECLDAMSPQVAAAILRCASQHHWPDSLHTQLVRVATNLLYVGDTISSAGRRGSSQQQDNGQNTAESILDSRSDGELSFKTAATESDSAGPHMCSHGGLRLSLARLQAFGGGEEAARHLRAATSRESRRNLLCILLDCIVARLCKGMGEEADDGTRLLESPEDAALVGHILAAGSMADALGAAFVCGLPGFALPIASSLTLPGDHTEAERKPLQTIVRLVLEQMEALAVSTAAGELTPALLPALTHTLACVNAPAAPEGITGVWACLTDLFCSSEPRSAQLAESWLLRLLVAAAERHLEEHEGDGVPALLPSTTSFDSEGFGSEQEQLVELLQHIMSRATPEVNTAARLVLVAQRLLLVVKQRCSLACSFPMELTSPPISPPFLKSLRGAARIICTPRPSAGKEGSGGHRRAPSLDVALHRGQLSEDTFYSPTVSSDQELLPAASADRAASRFALESASSGSNALAGASPEVSLQRGQDAEPDDEAAELQLDSNGEPSSSAVPNLDLTARGDSARQEQREHSEIRQQDSAGEAVAFKSSLRVDGVDEQAAEEQSSPWHSYNAVDLSLATMGLLVQWLLHTPDLCRQEAFLEMGHLLITSLALHPHAACPSAGLSAADMVAAADETTREAESPSEQDAVGIVSAFLAGTVGVPHELLSKVSPVMLATIFQNLPQGASTKAWSGAMKKDMRAAILLLLAARCKGSLADTHAAGGSSSFVDMLSDSDPRIRHIAASFLQDHFMVTQPDAYRRGLRQLLMHAQQSAEDRLRNTFLQVSVLLEMRILDPAA